MRIILLGAPGAGKGTHASILTKKYNIPIIATGNVFRYHIKHETELGLKVKEYMDRGALVPDEIVAEIVEDKIFEDKYKNGFILDGFPRTLRQAEILDEFLENLNEKIDSVINLEIEDEEIIERMKNRRVCPCCGETYNIQMYSKKFCKECGTTLIIRKDDKEETVRKRLEIYYKETKPLVKYYENHKNLLHINADQELKEVQNDIASGLEEA